MHFIFIKIIFFKAADKLKHKNGKQQNLKYVVGLPKAILHLKTFLPVYSVILLELGPHHMICSLSRYQYQSVVWNGWITLYVCLHGVWTCNVVLRFVVYHYMIKQSVEYTNIEYTKSVIFWIIPVCFFYLAINLFRHLNSF